MIHPVVMRATEAATGPEGGPFLRTTDARMRLASGIHLRMTPYIGIFMPLSAVSCSMELMA